MHLFEIRHPWDVTPKEAKGIQETLRAEVVREDLLGEVRRVAGVDVGFEERGKVARAAVVVLNFPSLSLHEQSVARLPLAFPYVPGLLSFREAPVVLDALANLAELPDLLLCDGQGIAHPRRFGIACHLGVLTGIPAIGVAKRRLVGEHGKLADKKGSRVPLFHKEEVIGTVLRSREGVRPLFVSAGHRIGLESSVRYVMACLTRFRLPETTRMAHRLASG